MEDDEYDSAKNDGFESFLKNDENENLLSSSMIQFMEEKIREDEKGREEVHTALNSPPHEEITPNIHLDAEISVNGTYRQIKTDICFQNWIGWISESLVSAIEIAENIADGLASSSYGITSSIIYIILFVTLIMLLIAIYLTLIIICSIGYIFCSFLNN